MKTAQQVRDYVRLYAEVDSTEVPDDLLNQWIVDAQRAILRSRKQWPHLETIWTLPLVAATSIYTTPTGSDDFIRVHLDGVRLTRISTTEGVDFQTAGASTPSHYSVSGQSLMVWPTPSASGTLSILGSRLGSEDWVTTTGVADLPRDYETCLLKHVMASAFEHETDTAMAQVFMIDFEVSLKLMNSSENREDQDNSPVMGGGNPSRWPRTTRIIWGS